MHLCVSTNLTILTSEAVNYYHKSLDLGCCSSPKPPLNILLYNFCVKLVIFSGDILIFIAQSVAKRWYEKSIIFKKFATFIGRHFCRSRHSFYKFVERPRTAAFIIDCSRDFLWNRSHSVRFASNIRALRVSRNLLVLVKNSIVSFNRYSVKVLTL